MSEQPLITSTTRISAPLGLRFWDAATRQAVTDGLDVTIYPMVNPDRRLPASPNWSGVYVFQRLPVLGQPDIPDGGPDPFWTAPLLKDGSRAGFTVEVLDRMGRFQPFQFPVTELFRGIFNWTCAALSPLASPLDLPLNLPLPGIPLFSTASRPVPGGMAAVRADLRQVLPANPDGLKASWAFLEVFYKGKGIGRGLADRNGQVLVIFPYPQPVISSTSSGLLGAPLPLFQQSWKIEVEAHFQLLDPLPQFPDLCQVLSSPKVTLRQPVSPTSPPGTLTIQYGQDTVLKSDGKSELFFTNP